VTKDVALYLGVCSLDVIGFRCNICRRQSMTVETGFIVPYKKGNSASGVSLG
jgi:hypothetical protein